MEITDWRSLIEGALQARSRDDYSIFPIWRSPTSSQTLSDLETTLGRPLPQELKEILRVSDGVDELMRIPGREEEIGDFLWPAAHILAEATRLPADCVFFADAGNGDRFGFSISAGDSNYGPIIVHDHETDEKRPVVASLREFVRWYGIGKLIS